MQFKILIFYDDICIFIRIFPSYMDSCLMTFGIALLHVYLLTERFLLILLIAEYDQREQPLNWNARMKIAGILAP